MNSFQKKIIAASISLMSVSPHAFSQEFNSDSGIDWSNVEITPRSEWTEEDWRSHEKTMENMREQYRENNIGAMGYGKDYVPDYLRSDRPSVQSASETQNVTTSNNPEASWASMDSGVEKYEQRKSVDPETGEVTYSIDNLNNNSNSSGESQGYIELATQKGVDKAAEYIQSGKLQEKGHNKLYELASDKLGQDLADKLIGQAEEGEYAQESKEEDEGGVYIPPVRSQASLCESETAKRVEEFSENLSNKTCESIETNPDPKNSSLSYQSDDVGCNFKLPGMKDMGSSNGKEPERCKGVSAITGSLVDKGVGMLNESWNKEADNLAKKAEESTGIKADDWKKGYDKASHYGKDAFNSGKEAFNEWSAESEKERQGEIKTSNGQDFKNQIQDKNRIDSNGQYQYEGDSYNIDNNYKGEIYNGKKEDGVSTLNEQEKINQWQQDQLLNW